MLPEAERRDLAAFTRRVLIVAAVVTGLWALWKMATFVILAFAGVLLAVILHRTAALLARLLRIGRIWGLALLLVLAAVTLVGGGALFGAQAVAQFQELSQTVEQGFGRIREWMDDTGLMAVVEDTTGGGLLDGGMAMRVMTVASTLFDFVVGVLIIVFVGIYLAVSPGTYRTGTLMLFPPSRQDRIATTLDAMGEGLWRWTLGQLVSMLAVGVGATVLLLALDVPMALALGIVAGVLEFIPILGPWLGAVPAVLVALTVDVATAGWVALGFFVLQQVESYVIAPAAARWAVHLPPALAVAATVIFTLLFGFLGLVFATPFMVAVIIAVRSLYIRGALQQDPGDGRMPG
ncbi:AI-2E family transporter [Caenispirillum bisanense]|uniref:AI-2E family transporter n=1 Tax=Caenispirillum bisanense TaxID=414052 RepID=UPI0031D38FA2